MYFNKKTINKSLNIHNINMKSTNQSNSPQESVSKTAANLYAALAASALEDEDDLVSDCLIRFV